MPSDTFSKFMDNMVLMKEAHARSYSKWLEADTDTQRKIALEQIFEYAWDAMMVPLMHCEKIVDGNGKKRALADMTNEFLDARNSAFMQLTGQEFDPPSCRILDTMKEIRKDKEV